MTDQPQTKNPPQTVQEIRRQELQYSGPIPPPAMLEQYNKVVPGAAERILKMAEEQSQHRQSLEKKVIFTDAKNSTLGIYCALAISLGFLCITAYAIYLNEPWAASIISALSISALVGTFVYGTNSRKQERENRLRESRS